MTAFTLPIPTYQCHKRVQALKIKAIWPSPRGMLLGFEDQRFAPHEVHQDWYSKHDPVEGGYLVVYEDGYQSFSPAAAFEAGYSLVDTGPFVIDEAGAEFKPVGPATQAAREVKPGYYCLGNGAVGDKCKSCAHERVWKAMNELPTVAYEAARDSMLRIDDDVCQITSGGHWRSA